MKKIMFNDKYGLTQAVLEGRKTMTRRIAYRKEIKYSLEVGYDTKTHQCLICNGEFIVARSQYHVGDVVAIAQPYKDIYDDAYHIGLYGRTAGWSNKMYVAAYRMPHHIKITNIRVEHLQDISDEDCLKEGVYMDYDEHGGLYTTPYYDYPNNKHDGFDTPREAFAALIDKVSGKGTWDSNPMVWVYEFELVN